MWNPELYLKAHYFAAEAHLKQCLPASEIPYLVHVQNVTTETMRALALSPSLNADLAIACALLHDTIEDTHIIFEQVVTAFGTEIGEGVLALTKDETLEKSLQMPDSLARIKKQPIEVWMVKLADRIDNLRKPPIYWDKTKIKSYWLEAQLIAKELQGGNEHLEKRLAEKIENYTQYFLE
jgi:(p)ppGpp synthase/HD superfamily hydrolase